MPVILVILLLIMLVPSYAKVEKINVLTEEKSIISYDIAKDTLIKNNRTLKQKQLEERKTFYTYSDIAQISRGINTEGRNVSMFGMDFFISFPDDIQMLLTMQKEFMPFVQKFGWQMSVKEKELTKTVLILTLRDLYLGLYSASKNYDISEKKLELEKKKNSANNTRFENGLISRLEFEESQYQFLKAQKDFESVQRDLENMRRNFNSFLGISIDTEYEEFLFYELKRNIRIQPLEHYIEKALENRLELIVLKGQIEMAELQISIYEKNRVNETYTKVGKEYNEALRQLEKLEIQLKQAKIDIENEIKSAYIEVKKEGYNLQNLNETLNVQTKNYQRMQSQYKQGLVAKLVVDEIELGLEELKNGLDLSMYIYNTKIMKLQEAAGLGPAF